MKKTVILRLAAEGEGSEFIHIQKDNGENVYINAYSGFIMEVEGMDVGPTQREYPSWEECWEQFTQRMDWTFGIHPTFVHEEWKEWFLRYVRQSYWKDSPHRPLGDYRCEESWFSWMKICGYESRMKPMHNTSIAIDLSRLEKCKIKNMEVDISKMITVQHLVDYLYMSALHWHIPKFSYCEQWFLGNWKNKKAVPVYYRKNLAETSLQHAGIHPGDILLLQLGAIERPEY